MMGIIIYLKSPEKNNEAANKNKEKAKKNIVNLGEKVTYPLQYMIENQSGCVIQKAGYMNIFSVYIYTSTVSAVAARQQTKCSDLVFSCGYSRTSPITVNSHI